MYTLQNSINWALNYVNYSPLSAGFGFEPAISVASMIRNSILNAPQTWAWNRAEDSSLTTVAGTQDYTVDITNFGFLEKCSMQAATTITNVVGNGTTATLTTSAPFLVNVGDTVAVSGLSHTAFNGTFKITAVTSTTFSFLSSTSQSSASDTGSAVGGEIFELKEVLNTAALGVASFQQQPHAVAVLLSTIGTSVKIRFMGVPNTAYAVTLTYQIASPQFGPFTVTSVANHVSADTTYTGVFSPLSFPAGGTATIIGCTTPANNGSFAIVSCNATSLVVANGSGSAESETSAYALNLSWSPIPDQYSDVYNNLFLSEAFSDTDDARAQMYRQRGVAAFLSKFEGLTQAQKNAFVQQWLSRSVENAAALLQLQQGVQARGI